jgi:putative ABC transport system permease protein
MTFRFISACHRLLVRVYPRRFRLRHGAELQALFDATLREEAPLSPRRRAIWMLVLLARSIGAALRVRWDQRSAAGSPGIRARNTLRGLSFGIRLLRRQPGFAAAAIATLALGIGANAAVFGVVDAVLLRPLPYPAPERVVEIKGRSQGFVRLGPTSIVWPSALEDSSAFTAIGLYFTGGINFSAESALRLSAAGVSPAFFEVLGVAPARGRTFTTDEPGAAGRVAVISHRVWRDHLRGDPAVVGRSIDLDGSPFTVIGVMPPRVSFPAGTDIWVPTGAPTGVMGVVPVATVFARVADGVPISSVRDVVIAAADVGPEEAETVRVDSLRDALSSGVRPIAVAVWMAAALVLVVATINTTNLLLTRVARRRREFMVRGALGATRADLVRQILAESLVLSTLGAAAAIPAAWWILEAARMLLPATLHGVADIGFDTRMLAAIGGVTVVTAFLFGLGPALSLRTGVAADGLRGHAAAGGDRRWHRFRSGLLVAEIAIALVLLAGATALVSSVQAVMRVDMGASGDRAVAMELSLPRAKYAAIEARRTFFRQIESVVTGLPGVEDVGLSNQLPGRSASLLVGTSIEIEGAPAPATRAVAVQLSASPGYFSAIGIQLLAGRSFTGQDGPEGVPVAIVSEGFASRLGLAPATLIGRRLGRPAGRDRGEPQTIVGVVRDVRLRGPDDAFAATVYLPFAVEAPRSAPAYLVVRGTSDPMGLVAGIRAALSQVDRNVPVSNIKTFEEIRESLMTQQRLATLTMLIFAALTFSLAVIGLYSVISYVVQVRTREIGIRLAMGASRSGICGAILRSGLAHTAIGLIVGASAAAFLLRTASSRISSIEVPSPMVLVLLSLAIAAVAALATLIPAWRAARIDPAVTLRAE